MCTPFAFRRSSKDITVTAGHHVSEDEGWFYKFGEWLDDFVGQDVDVVRVNGAAPGGFAVFNINCLTLA